ncbi:hypothetical protein BOX15_Mlig015778g1 [Macrostomum lignano]|uniref:Uncharacterized protein n=2 Tax=Macrostomum lignano TaxID=282301 RepID=A0A1I8FT78_9PLAT|nr:hypothetical protein BOX15_Mlig015778g1 [Macrostomum lignano]
MTSLALAERIKELLKQRQDLHRHRRRKAASTTSGFGSGDSNKVQLNKRRLRASVDGLPPPPPPPPQSWLGAIFKIPAFKAASVKSARAAEGFLSQLESALNAPPQPLPPRRQRQAQRGRRSHRGAAGRLRRVSCCQPVRQHHVAATSGCCRRVPELRIARVSPLPAASGRHHYSNRSPVRHRVQRCRCCFRQTAPGCLADAEVENCPAMRIYCQSEDDYLLPDCAEEANFLSWTVSANLGTPPPPPTVSMATVTDEARGVTWDSGDPLVNKKKNCCC